MKPVKVFLILAFFIHRLRVKRKRLCRTHDILILRQFCSKFDDKKIMLFLCSYIFKLLSNKIKNSWN